MLLPFQPCLLILGIEEGLRLGKYEILPRIAPAPLERRLHRRARHERTFEQLEPQLQDLPLLGRIVRLAARAAERKIRMDEAWNAYILNDIARGSKHYCGNAIRL